MIVDRLLVKPRRHARIQVPATPAQCRRLAILGFTGDAGLIAQTQMERLDPKIQPLIFLQTEVLYFRFPEKFRGLRIRSPCFRDGATDFLFANDAAFWLSGSKTSRVRVRIRQ
jgi:hypothetical protein